MLSGINVWFLFGRLLSVIGNLRSTTWQAPQRGVNNQMEFDYCNNRLMLVLVTSKQFVRWDDVVL